MQILQKLALLALLCACLQATAQTTYTNYFTGDTTDVTVAAKGGVCLMGGATESDDAMRWFLAQAGGGDILIIRASGSNGYNDYLYSQLGMTVNSVESIVINNAAAANDPYVIRRIREADGLWIAGGNQANYVNFWKNSPMRAAINYLINTKKVVVGGTSAGMAVLSGNYFAALNGSATSATALANPYDATVTLGHNDFINYPLLQNVVTDTHYDNPDRKGRHLAFMARLMQDYGTTPFGIACEEYTAFCADSTGEGKVFGPAGKNAYFLRANCVQPNTPEVCANNSPLTWDNAGEAVKAYVVPATITGTNTFNISDWLTGTGGNWENWFVQAGVLTTEAGLAPNCPVVSTQTPTISLFPNLKLYPNPASHFLIIENMVDKTGINNVDFLEIQDETGRVLKTQTVNAASATVDLSNLPAATYFLSLHTRVGKASYPFNVR